MIKNQEMCEDILECINTLQDACSELYNIGLKGNYGQFAEFAVEMHTLLNKIGAQVEDLSEEEQELKNTKVGLIDNAIYSIEQILRYERTRSSRLFSKIEFELLPLIDELYADCYYLFFVKGDDEKTRNFNENEAKQLYACKYTDESLKAGNYKYDVSIVVGAYNKLDYTKLCVESIIENTPSSIKYELILRNHGSSDGTKEYFESIGCTKQIDLEYNGIGGIIVLRVLEGKYTCFISNDVIVGPNYLENMLRCIESDDRIMWVVPTTTNISNLQTIPCSFTTIAEMKAFAKSNNISDEYRWEQRVRLCNPIELIRTKDMFSTDGIGKCLRNFKQNGFGDDIASLLVRRAGGKNMLAKDAFCYHFGSITLGEDKIYNSNENFQRVRTKFHGFFGVDPWGKGFCYTQELINKLSCNNTGETHILGINCGLGSNPLKVREAIKENVHNLSAFVYNVTDEKNYYQDITGVSDEALFVNTQQELFSAFYEKKFDYIIFEGDLFKYSNPKNIVLQLLNRLNQNGILAIFDSGDKCKQSLKPISPTEEFAINNNTVGDGVWYLWKSK